jgi:hypothetical protein
MKFLTSSWHTSMQSGKTDPDATLIFMPQTPKSEDSKTPNACDPERGKRRPKVGKRPTGKINKSQN